MSILINTYSSIKKHRYEIGGFLGLTLILFLFSLSPRGSAITARVYDPLRITAERNEVVVVGIDDESLQTFGAWPWDRTHFANLAKKLNEAEVRVAIYDILFFEPRAGDDLFFEQLTQEDTLHILGSKISNNEYYESFLDKPNTPTILSALVNVSPDSDGKVRKYPEDVLQEGCHLPLAKQAFLLLTRKPVECTKDTAVYFRYSPHVTTYSIKDVVLGGVGKNELKDKTVFIGATSIDLNDNFVSLYGEKIPGVEVHASIYTSLLNGIKDQEVTPFVSFISILLFAILGAFGILWVKQVRYQMVVIIGSVLFGLLVIVITFSSQYILPAPFILISPFVGAAYTNLIKMRHERRQGDYLRGIFSKYVNKDILHQLLSSGATISLTGEKKELTVLFSDLRGFTTFSETLTPEALMKLLNDYFSAMATPILKENGTIDKFIGDAIMAFWNAPLTIPNPEDHAVRAALGMDKALSIFNKEHATDLEMGIGVHTGDAIVGNVGSHERVNYTALGDTVNLGSRLEGLTKKYGVHIIISGEVKAKLTQKYIMRKLDVVKVKGKNTATVLYQIAQEEDISLDTILVYEKALDFYLKGEFNEAIETFSQLPHDPTSLMMKERCHELLLRNEWKGVWVFDEK